MNYTKRGMSSEEIRSVACPMCGELAGSPCSVPFVGGTRKNHHAERVALARRHQSLQRQALAEGEIRRRIAGQNRDAARVSRQVADRFYRP